MWMKFWAYSICLFLFVQIGVAQDVSVELEKRVNIKADFIEADNIGNAYLLKGSSMMKLDMKGVVLAQNSKLFLGEINSFDASNALKMLVYFKDLSQITYIDNQLAPRGDDVSLDVLGYNQITAICRSYNDGVWVYDQTTFELTRLDDQLQKNVETGNLSQILDYVPEPNYMREFNNWLYVNDPEHGILVFDWYGSYMKTIPIIGVRKFVLRADRLFFVKDHKVQYYNLKTNQFFELNTEAIDVIDFTIFENNLLEISQNELLIYRISVN